MSRDRSHFQRKIKSSQSRIIFSKATIEILVSFYDRLSEDRDFLFESKRVSQFDEDNEIFAHIVNFSLIFVQLRNSTFASVKLLKHSRLETLVKY